MLVDGTYTAGVGASKHSTAVAAHARWLAWPRDERERVLFAVELELWRDARTERGRC